MEQLPLIAIVGPTAVGKTALSIELAQHYDGEIISGDSMQVYRGMDIGTAKITADETQGIPHHMIDILDPDQESTALSFKNRAQTAIEEIAGRGHVPMLVGGTGLYVNGLLYDYSFTGERNDDYRNKLFDALKSGEDTSSYQRLLALRPDLKDVIHEKDHFRIARALEIIETEGKDQLKNFDMKANYQSPYRLCLIGLTMDRAKLYERINRRVDLMLENGLLEEVEKLLQQGYNKEMQSLKAIGYKEMIAYLQGELSYEAAVSLLKKNTRHFAKRQLTWFRRDPNLKWFHVDEMDHETLLARTIEYADQCLGLNEERGDGH
ncbi:MAG: tRNA (adenosine(37)-N6)-dimethylallyltransferase MiaA [Peptococcaceae bacterium]|nr:tRNA (adenosine(37)-N6)-dimethylallyltransferase MiaA [Peptococcaceae bacterium]